MIAQWLGGSLCLDFCFEGTIFNENGVFCLGYMGITLRNMKVETSWWNVVIFNLIMKESLIVNQLVTSW